MTVTSLYLTADVVGTPTGGGLVTAQELQALRTLGGVDVISRAELQETVRHYSIRGEPWCWDEIAYYRFGSRIRLCHAYSGTFSQCVEKLKGHGAKVCYTVAAHSVEASRKEHEKYGIDYAKLYPHLCEPKLWQRYIKGYMLADCVVVPSKHSEQVVRGYGYQRRIEVIPHGCTLPEQVAPLPPKFTVGYLGSVTAPDKGVRYLLEAWKKLAYKDALLVLAGKDSTSPTALQMVRQFGGGNVQLMGWVEDVSSFYNSLSLYVQPSATEGYGLEVVEAMAHGRAVLCSTGAGAADAVPLGLKFSPCKPDELADALSHLRHKDLLDIGCINRDEAADYSWDKIRQRYVDLWQEVTAT